MKQLSAAERFSDIPSKTAGPSAPKKEPSPSPAEKPSGQDSVNWDELLADVGVDTQVSHKKFGDGTITWISADQKYMRVKFPVGEKQFLFPDAFIMGFLTLK